MEDTNTTLDRLLYARLSTPRDAIVSRGGT
jgi:hypothetical protein